MIGRIITTVNQLRTWEKGTGREILWPILWAMWVGIPRLIRRQKTLSSSLAKRSGISVQIGVAGFQTGVRRKLTVGPKDHTTANTLE
jgi:hypothetical protein